VERRGEVDPASEENSGESGEQMLLWDGMFCIIEMLINYAGAVIALPALPSLAGDILDGTCDSLDRPMYLANEAIAEAARFRSALGAIASVGVRG